MKIEIKNGYIEAESNSHSGKAWLAKVTKGGRFGLKRDFGSKMDVTQSGNKYRDLQLSIGCKFGDQIEFASQESSSRHVRLYYRVGPEGSLKEINLADVV